MSESSDVRPGRFVRLRERFLRDIGSVEAEELMADSREAGGTPVSECCTGEPVDVHGTVRSVIIRPRGGVPAFEAEVYDGTGKLRVIWLGRRRVQGIEPGRMMVVHGRINESEGRPTMFNPRYTLRPGPDQ